MRNGSPAKTRVAIAGLGAIGCEVAKALDRGIDGLELAAVSAANIDKHRPWLDKLQKTPACITSTKEIFIATARTPAAPTAAHYSM